jgi:predicted RNA-binding Zn-ribbon protein involved in translation (DUF1610 family)
MKMNWELAEFCVKCGEFLDYDEVIDSNGVCPFCGFDSISTICETKRKVRRWISDGKYESLIDWILGISTGHWEYKE